MREGHIVSSAMGTRISAAESTPIYEDSEATNKSACLVLVLVVQKLFIVLVQKVL